MSARADYDPKCADRYHAYRQGWRDGASGRPRAKPFIEHATRPDMIAAYVAGYEAADWVTSKALLRAQWKYKFTPSVIRDAAAQLGGKRP